VDVVRESGDASVEPALGPEIAGLVPPTGIAVKDPGSKVDRRPRGNRVTAEGAVGERLAPDHIRWGTEPERFLDDRFDVRKTHQIRRRRKPLAEPLGDLPRRASGDFRMPGEQIERPGGRDRRRGMPRAKE